MYRLLQWGECYEKESFVHSHDNDSDSLAWRHVVASACG